MLLDFIATVPFGHGEPVVPPVVKRLADQVFYLVLDEVAALKTIRADYQANRGIPALAQLAEFHCLFFFLQAVAQSHQVKKRNVGAGCASGLQCPVGKLFSNQCRMQSRIF